MKITDGAKQLLEDFLNEKGAEGIRISSIAGCCGPQFAISLDAPEETDKIETINGIQVAIDSEVRQNEELTLDKGEGQSRPKLVLVSERNCC